MLKFVSPQSHPREPSHESEGTSYDQMVSLLSRYPTLNAAELGKLVHLYREMSALELAHLLSDAEIAPVLNRFHAENRSRLRRPFGEYAVFVFIAVAAVATAGWATMF